MRKISSEYTILSFYSFRAIFYGIFARDVFIIGGLVDHNRLVNITLNKAKEQGIRTQRFRLEGNIDLNSRSILAVNHCKKSINLIFFIFEIFASLWSQS